MSMTIQQFVLIENLLIEYCEITSDIENNITIECNVCKEQFNNNDLLSAVLNHLDKDHDLIPYSGYKNEDTV